MFVARQRELKVIGEVLTKKSASVLVYGKRKVGKTTLILQALKNSGDKTVYYECLRAPIKENIAGLVSALTKAGVLPVPMAFESFQDLFAYINTLNGTFNIVIDEYPYLKKYEKSDYVDSVFQAIIDNHISNVRLFVSGSHISMMKELLNEGNALYGRFGSVIVLHELNYREASAFYPQKSAYDKIAFYSVFGGSPFVNEQLNADADLKSNIINTLLDSTSSVYVYADNMLISDLSNIVNAERIFGAIGNGKKRYNEIEGKLSMKSNGLLSKNLETLLKMELLSKIYPINKSDDDKKSMYELSDNVLRFWYTYVYKNKSALQTLGAEAFYESYIAPSLTTFISHRFEEIAKVYFSLCARAGKLKGVLNIGTYYYDDSASKTNGEFDVVLQRADVYDIYEVKYYSTPLFLKEMRGEEKQIKAIKGINVGKVGFIAANGFEELVPEYECFSGEDLYSERL